MKKRLVGSLVFVILISSFFTFIPNALSQPENVQVLSYSWHFSLFDYLIVVGEVQNVGPNNIDSIFLGGFVYTNDGEPQAESYTWAFSEQILPQQKVPFRLIISDENSYIGNLGWLSIGISHVVFEVFNASQTDDYQYPDLEIIDEIPHIDSDGRYRVNGSIWNTGNQAAGRLWVVATFYNVSGHVIAAGFSNYLTPDSLPPGQTTSFTVTPRIDFGLELSSQITNYALLIQTEAPIIPEFPSFLILPLFMVATLPIVIVYRKRLKRASK